MENLFDATRNKLEFKEILRLKEMLEREQIPFNIEPRLGGWRIAYPSDEDGATLISIIENYGSYGYLNDRIEILEFQSGTGDPVGYLTAEEVFALVQKYESGIPNS